ncbi:MAG: hypothetical protein WC366_03505 [Bacilli bacterium]|jgi:hypothetical protein
MKELFSKANDKIKLLLVVLLIGGLWGLLEATLGTLLHLQPFESMGMFMGSSVIMIPIAYSLLTIAWKKTGKYRAMMYCGFVAATIKLTLLILPFFWTRTQSVINPAISIVLESLCMAAACYVIKPNRALSTKMFFAIFIADFAWRVAFVGLQGIECSLFNMTSKSFYISGGLIIWDVEYFYSFAFLLNFISLAYCAIIGSIAYGVNYALVKKNVKIPTLKIDNIVFNPLFVSAVVALAIGSTILLELI